MLDNARRALVGAVLLAIGLTTHASAYERVELARDSSLGIVAHGVSPEGPWCKDYVEVEISVEDASLYDRLDLPHLAGQLSAIVRELCPEAVGITYIAFEPVMSEVMFVAYSGADNGWAFEMTEDWRPSAASEPQAAEATEQESSDSESAQSDPPSEQSPAAGSVPDLSFRGVLESFVRANPTLIDQDDFVADYGCNYDQQAYYADHDNPMRKEAYLERARGLLIEATENAGTRFLVRTGSRLAEYDAEHERFGFLPFASIFYPLQAELCSGNNHGGSAFPQRFHIDPALDGIAPWLPMAESEAEAFLDRNWSKEVVLEFVVEIDTPPATAALHSYEVPASVLSLQVHERMRDGTLKLLHDFPTEELTHPPSLTGGARWLTAAGLIGIYHQLAGGSPDYEAMLEPQLIQADEFQRAELLARLKDVLQAEMSAFDGSAELVTSGVTETRFGPYDFEQEHFPLEGVTDAFAFDYNVYGIHFFAPYRVVFLNVDEFRVAPMAPERARDLAGSYFNDDIYFVPVFARPSVEADGRFTVYAHITRLALFDADAGSSTHTQGVRLTEPLLVLESPSEPGTVGMPDDRPAAAFELFGLHVGDSAEKARIILEEKIDGDVGYEEATHRLFGRMGDGKECRLCVHVWLTADDEVDRIEVMQLLEPGARERLVQLLQDRYGQPRFLGEGQDDSRLTGLQRDMNVAGAPTVAYAWGVAFHRPSPEGGAGVRRYVLQAKIASFEDVTKIEIDLMNDNAPSAALEEEPEEEEIKF